MCCILAYKIPSHSIAYKYAVIGGLKKFEIILEEAADHEVAFC